MLVCVADRTDLRPSVFVAFVHVFSACTLLRARISHGGSAQAPNAP